MNNVTRLFNYHTNFNFNCLNNTYINNISKFYINNIINKHIFINKKFINKTYSYDKNGNIILKNGVSSSYDTTIKDRLISIGEDTITYNSTNVLLPNTYRNNRLVFEGKRLIRFITNSQHYDYEYDDSGIRTRKVNTYGIGHNFIYEGNKLINDKTNDYELDFLYDENDILYEFIKDKTSIYYYVRDILGNILGITDSYGTLIVKYNLDAYGKLISITGSDANTIGKINPFRYKGYYYDEETRFYYLISRYYDPETGRFISSDNINYFDPQNINNLNFYVYCSNDPINLYDPFGNLSLIPLLIGFGVSSLIGMIVGGVSYVLSEQISYSFTKEFSWSDAQFVGNLLGGAIGGGLSIIPFFGPIFVSFLTGFLSTGIGMHLQNKWEGKNYTKDEILFASFVNGAISALAFKFFELIKIPGLTSGKGSYKAISKQISTKFIRGIISSISFKTFSKIFTYNLAGTFTEILCSGLMDAINANDLLVDFYNRRPLDYF